jgi:hypothetical protein
MLALLTLSLLAGCGGGKEDVNKGKDRPQPPKTTTG